MTTQQLRLVLTEMRQRVCANSSTRAVSHSATRHPSPCMLPSYPPFVPHFPHAAVKNQSTKYSCTMAMMINSSRLIYFFLLSVIFSLVAAADDPEVQVCKRQCWAQREFTRRERQECEQKCQDYYRQKHGEGGGEGEGDGPIVLNSEVDPEKQLRQCRKQCERGQQKELCRRQCQETYERQREEEKGKEGAEEEKEVEEGNQGERKDQQDPYVFRDEHYVVSQESNEGRVKILDRFDRRSPLLRGLQNYRFLSIEANPQTFLLPSHLDADAVLYVASGLGTISLVFQGKKESFNIQQGDVVRIRAGTTVYMINRSKNKKLRIAKLIQPVSLPGEFRAFYGSSGQKSSSFFKVFSPELLATALKADQEKVERVIGQQNKGLIVKASEEQIKALSQREEAELFSFSFLRRSKRVFNILRKDPTFSNKYGQLHEIDADDFPALKDMDVGVAYSNVTKGAMEGPVFNSRSTKIALVVRGEGYMAMACPHVAQEQKGEHGDAESRSEEEGTTQHYQRISAKLKRGTLFVVPTGHPIILVAGNDRNLEIACFAINAENNWQETLAGDKNTVEAMEKEAKELAFGVPAREVDEVFGKQQERFFFPGPKESRAYA